MSETVLIPKDTGWNDPVRATVVNRKRDQIPERERRVRLAISDPGAFTGRGLVENPGTHDSVYEDLVHWAARAVLIALAEFDKD